MYRPGGTLEGCLSCPKVSLRIITGENWREVLELSVDAEQLKFVAGITPFVVIALAWAYIRPSGRTVEPCGIYDRHNLVRFLNLHYSPGSTDDFWIFHFFIDQRFQRRGLGFDGIKALKAHRGHTHLLQANSLDCLPDNDVAQKFYTRLGFTNDNILTDGEPTYSLPIDED